MSLSVLVTGGAGFIGSNLVDFLIKDDKIKLVRVIDNLSTGYYKNITSHINNPKFEFIEGDITSYETCLSVTEGIDCISHQAALGSVPRSIANPMKSTEVNILGTVNLLYAAVQNKVDRIVIACSSSTYGDSPILPKVENQIGRPLSPYAVTKYSVELFADVFKQHYNLDYIGLRYFNIFGPKQNPDNPYAAVIPIFCKAFIEDSSPLINGDGETSRDFTYIDNAVQANVKALFTQSKKALNQIYNVACNDRVSLNEIIDSLQRITGKNILPNYGLERPGDVKHSEADICKIKTFLGYEPTITFELGLSKVYEWYLQQSRKEKNNSA